MRRIFLAAFLLFVTAFISWGAFAEQITITTYYPAPFGVYKDLQAETLTVTNDNEEIILGGDSDSPGIELRDNDGGGNTPYIDFTSFGGGDYDYRIILTGDDSLWVRGGTTTFADDSGNPTVIKTGEIWFCSSFPGT